MCLERRNNVITGMETFVFAWQNKKINLSFKSRPRKEFGFGLNSQGETGGG